MYHCHILLYTVYYAVWRLCFLLQEYTVGDRPAKYCHQPCSTICVVSLIIIYKKRLQSPHSIKWLAVHRLIQESRYGQHWFWSFGMLLLRYRPHFWRLGCHLSVGTGRDPKNLRVRFSLSFPEEDLCPVHEFSWWSLGRNAVGRQMTGRKAAEGGWLILDHAGRLIFQPRLVVTGAIVIGRDDGISGTSHPVTIKMRFLASWRTTTGPANC